MFKIFDTGKTKVVKSPDYNSVFYKDTGVFARWGRKIKDDPDMCPVGPEILDMEISTICHQGCKFCYKSNTATGKNMDLETFKIILSKFPETLTQIAFGIGSIDANLDLWNIFQHCRENDIVPNVTINGYRMTNEYYYNLSKYCGAVAVSLYDKDVCYEAVRELTDRDMKQVNIHMLLSEETYDTCNELIHDMKTDPRLEHLNAVVFLALKKRGRGTHMHNVGMDKYKILVDKLISSNVNFGFDSCSACKFMEVAPQKYHQYAEPCESSCFSMYINVDGYAFPCSFTENGTGVDMKTINEFDDAWYSKEFGEFREKLLKNKRNCPVYNVIGES
jgi:hypothetical protein